MVPRYPVDTLSLASLAVTVTLMGVPAVAVPVEATTDRWVPEPAVNVPLVVWVIVRPSVVSVAWNVSVPAVAFLTVNVAWPLALVTLLPGPALAMVGVPGPALLVSETVRPLTALLLAS